MFVAMGGLGTQKNRLIEQGQGIMMICQVAISTLFLPLFLALYNAVSAALISMSGESP
jgi:hypothetical protein